MHCWLERFVAELLQVGVLEASYQFMDWLACTMDVSIPYSVGGGDVTGDLCKSLESGVILYRLVTLLSGEQIRGIHPKAAPGSFQVCE